MAVPAAGTLDLIAGGVTLLALLVAGSAGRTGSLEIFGFAGVASAGAEADGDAGAASAADFESEDLEGFAAVGELPDAGVGVPDADVVGTIEAILSFSTRTKPKSVLTLNMLSS